MFGSTFFICAQVVLTRACLPEKHTTILIQNYDGPIFLSSCQHSKDTICPPLYHILNCDKGDNDFCCFEKCIPESNKDAAQDVSLQSSVSLQITPSTNPPHCSEVPPLSRVPPCQTHPCLDCQYYQAPPYVSTVGCQTVSPCSQFTPCQATGVQYPCGNHNQYPYYSYADNADYSKAIGKGDVGSTTYWQSKSTNQNNCHCCKYLNRC